MGSKKIEEKKIMELEKEREEQYEYEMQAKMNEEAMQEMIALEGEAYLYGDC